MPNSAPASSAKITVSVDCLDSRSCIVTIPPTVRALLKAAIAHLGVQYFKLVSSAISDEGPPTSFTHPERELERNSPLQDGCSFLLLELNTLSKASPEERADKEYVLSVVSDLGEEIEHASEEMQCDKDVVTAALRNPALPSPQMNHPLLFARERSPQNWCWDRALVLAAICDGWADELFDWDKVPEIPHDIRNDRVVMSNAIRQHRIALKGKAPVEVERGEYIPLFYNCLLDRASGELKSDREFVVGAIRDYGCSLSALEYEDPAGLLQDRELVLLGLQNGRGRDLQYVSPELRGDRVVLEALLNDPDGHAICDASAELLADRDFMMVAVQLGYSNSLIPELCVRCISS